MEEMIIQFVSTYGWKLALIACSGIFVLGILKFFKIFDKINKENRKYVYAGVSSGLSISASAIYLIVVGGFSMVCFSVVAGAIYALNQSIYAVYENSGFRTLLRKLGNLFINFVAKNQLQTAKEKIGNNNEDKIV